MDGPAPTPRYPHCLNRPTTRDPAIAGKSKPELAASSFAPERVGSAVDPSVRMHRQFDQLVAHTQELLRQAPRRREEFWAKADPSSAEKWQSSTRFYRDSIWNDVIGRMPDPTRRPTRARG